mgnify:CR=1 FL=1
MEQLRPFTRDIVAYDVAPYNGGSKFCNGDTLMARITPCLENGKTAQVNFLDADEVGFGSTEFIVLRAKPGISDKDFVYYLAMSPFLRDKAIQSMVGSSGRQRVQQGVLMDIEIRVPPLHEQIKIGQTLRVLDDKIANNTKINHHVKILAAYHQYFAVHKTIASTAKAIHTDGKGGVFWHTQGSGKSLSMVFYAHLLQEALNSPTIVVITDRNDLDDQLYSQFAKCSDFLRQIPQHTENRQHLKELLAGRQANGIIFTTMQKFEESNEPLSTRRNIIVIADEAHRSQYGLEEKVNARTGHLTLGIARVIRDSLPNATYIGFTGTPISSRDRSTIEVFGNYIDIYDMTQAIEDGATRPVYYESRVIHLKLNEDILKQIDAQYDRIAEDAAPYAVEKSKKELSKKESILGAEQTITTLCKDIIRHYEGYRQYELTGKAMIVAYSRPIAMSIYRKLLELRPQWKEKVGVVMTAGNNDPEDWREIIGNKYHRDEIIEELMKMAKEMSNAHAEGETLGLTEEEMAFYDALTKPRAIKDFYRNDELVSMTRELTDMLRKNRTIDWQIKESARAGMRRMVKRLLKKYKYPPEGVDDAISTVIGQCEMWADN